jgi:sec-independent protein translocase protein TatA
MMGIGFPELMIILVIIMIIFGAGKLPEIGSAFGNSIRNFKKSMKEADDIKDDMDVSQALDENAPANAEIEGGNENSESTKEEVPATEEPQAK